MSPVRYELGYYITGYGILHNHRRENINSYSKDVVGNFVHNVRSVPLPVLRSLILGFQCSPVSVICWRGSGRNEVGAPR
jgi:hypothetical protein